MQPKLKLIAFLSAAAFLTSLNGFSQITNWLLPKTQITNAIPPNLFLNDDGFLFKFKKSGEAVIDLKRIFEAEKSPESHPAAEDPEGNWGEPTNGIQVSIRFSKKNYSVGEPLTTIVLVRNVTTNLQSYLSPLTVVVAKDGNILKRKNDMGISVITVSPIRSLFPQTQHRYQIDLRKDYDLNESGVYTFQAVCKQPEVASQSVTISITNAMAPRAN